MPFFVFCFLFLTMMRLIRLSFSSLAHFICPKLAKHSHSPVFPSVCCPSPFIFVSSQIIELPPATENAVKREFRNSVKMIAFLFCMVINSCEKECIGKKRPSKKVCFLIATASSRGFRGLSRNWCDFTMYQRTEIFVALFLLQKSSNKKLSQSPLPFHTFTTQHYTPSHAHCMRTHQQRMKTAIKLTVRRPILV